MASVNRFAARHEGCVLLRAALLLICLLLAASLTPPRPAGAGRRLQDIPSSYQRVAENDLFQLYVDSATLAFKLLDKRSNYLWHSGIDELVQGDRLNTISYGEELPVCREHTEDCWQKTAATALSSRVSRDLHKHFAASPNRSSGFDFRHASVIS